MTLLDAQQYDESRARRRRNRIIIAVIAILVLGYLGWMFRHWPQEHAVDHFFDALQSQNYEAAYSIWTHDPDWKQHPGEVSQLPLQRLLSRLGPGRRVGRG